MLAAALMIVVLLPLTTEVQERSNGYVFRLPSGIDILRDAGAPLAREPVTFAFVEIAIHGKQEGGPMWLSVSCRYCADPSSHGGALLSLREVRGGVEDDPRSSFS